MSFDAGVARDVGVSRSPHSEATIWFGPDDLAALLCDAIVLNDTLARIADRALRALPIADGAVVRLVGDSARAGAGTPVARTADDLHDALGEGPALDALDTGRVARCGSLGDSDRWRRFGPRAERMGLHSALSVPLPLARGPVGAITAYASTRDAFTDLDVGIAEYYALPAATVIRHAWLLEQSRRRVEQLTEALRVRPPIDQAVGLIMSRTGKSADEALETLRRMSNRRHVKVSDLSRELVDEAVRRAQRRRVRRPNSVPSARIAPGQSS